MQVLDTIQHCEWEELTKSIKDGEVSLVVTDPPYKSTPADWDRKWPLWLPFMQEMARICGDNGQLWIFCRMPWTVDVLLAAEQAGWVYVQERIWLKQNAGGCTAGNELRKIHETALHFKRSNAKTFNRDAIREPKTTKGNKSVKRRKSSDTQFLGTKNSAYVDDGFRIPKTVMSCRNVHRTDEATGHPTQKPIRFILPLVLYSSNPGDIVFDPYCGSGTTPSAAKMSGRHWIACDKTERWALKSIDRVSNTPKKIPSDLLPKGRRTLFGE